jgi:hypothetical protein
LIAYMDLFSITGAYFVDAFFVGGLMYWIWKRWFNK